MHEVTLVPGDWVGPECAEVVRDVLAAAGVDIRWDVHTSNDDAFYASARRTRRVLTNRLSASRVPGKLPRSVAIRKELGLWAQLRHVRSLPGVPARFSDVDVLVVRETSEDVYTGFEHQTAPGVFESIKLTTEAACERIARKAFSVARERGRQKVTIVHKSNIMKKADGLFLRTGQRVARDFPDIECDEAIVDALCMRLVRWPSSFDVLLCGNLFGDIVSDLCAGLAGGICVGGSVNVGDDVMLFANPHGKAPELVGTGRANPLPSLMVGVELVGSLGLNETADRLRRAILAALAAGLHTVDHGGSDGLVEVRDAVVSRL
ncbi:MAG TPA: isocitrate/isopropylmalate family dehydrogenase [Myxococcota bacterium]|nr:isocitrate/isopropylmalate family dehydrogenase [Myxococcota bacterium]